MAAALALRSPRTPAVSSRRADVAASTPRSSSDAHTQLAELAAAVEAYATGAGGTTSADADRLVTLCRSVEVRAYDFRPNDALRAVVLLSAAARAQEERRGIRALGVERPSYAHNRQALGDEQAAHKMRFSAQRVAASIAPRALVATPHFVADALATLSSTETARQEDLDALLARLLVLLREQPRQLTPAVVVRVTSSIGQMKINGGVAGCALCARDGVTDDTRAANQRCINYLGQHIQTTMKDFLEEDLAALDEVFAVTYLSRENLSHVLQRAAQLRAGLCVESMAHMPALGRLTAAIDSCFPALVDTLPDFALGYCKQLALMCQTPM